MADERNFMELNPGESIQSGSREQSREVSERKYFYSIISDWRFVIKIFDYKPFDYAILRALELLDRGWYTVSGTDLHNRGMLAKAGGMKLKKKVLERLEGVKRFKA